LVFIWSWLASAAELSGLWMIGSKKKFGFLVSIIGNLIWVVVALLGLPATGLLLVVIPAMFINVRNFIRWRGGEKRTSVEENCSSCTYRICYDRHTVMCTIWIDKYNIQRVPHNIKCQHYKKKEYLNGQTDQ